MLPCTSWGLDCTFPSSIGYSICFLFLVVSLCHCFSNSTCPFATQVYSCLCLQPQPIHPNKTLTKLATSLLVQVVIQMKYMTNIHSLPKQYQIMGNCLANKYQTHAAKHSTLLSTQWCAMSFFGSPRWNLIPCRYNTSPKILSSSLPSHISDRTCVKVCMSQNP